MQSESTTITQQHYDAFKYLFEQEELRYRDLIDKAKSYQTIVTAYTGLVIVVAGSNANGSSYLQLLRDFGIVCLSVLTVVFLVTSLILVILAQRVASQEGVVSADRLAEQLSARVQSKRVDTLPAGSTDSYDSLFAESMIAGFVVATIKNERVNNMRANCLWWASVFMTATITFHLFQVCFILLKG